MFQIALPMSKQVCASAGLLLLLQLLQIFGGCEILAAPDSIETSETLSSEKMSPRLDSAHENELEKMAACTSSYSYSYCY